MLLSHADLAHAGGLPYAFAELGLNCPVYATQPVAKMAPLALLDALAALRSTTDSPPFTKAHVTSVFQQHMHAVKYLQPMDLLRKDGSAADIVVTPYPAGHSVGGAVWKVTRGAEDMVYAPDFNHQRERLLDPTTLETLQRPSVLIAGATSAL